MSTQSDPTSAPASPEEAGLSPTTSSGLSENGATGLYDGVNDPNAAAMNENADAAQMRQLTGEVPGSQSAQNPDGLPPAQSEVFQDGT